MKQVMIRIPNELVDKIEAMAKEQSRSRSNMIRVLIEGALDIKKLDNDDNNL